jgi:GTPase
MLKDRIPYRSKKKPPLLDLDFTSHNQKHLIFRGGQGGFGNPHFRSPLIPGPGIAGRGIRVPPLHLQLELKSLADIGLVGLPNAGKSTLLKAVSNAHPKIANYPFTTLNPYIGTIDYPDFYSLTMADMPGIIKGASRDLGLGLRFLRHIERTKVFVYMVDLSGQEPLKDLEILKGELEAYKPGLTRRESILVGNKADVGDVARRNLEVMRESCGMPIVPISAMYGVNVTTLTALMRQLVVEVEEAEARADDVE